MARIHTVKAARKDYPDAGIKKGETYYWWEFRFGGTHRSKTRPRASQLTQSEFLGGLYAAQESIEDMKPESYDTVADFISDLDNVKSDVEQLGSDCEDKRSNMPDGLQEGDTGQLLEERASACQDLSSEFDSLDNDEPEKDSFLEEARANVIQEDNENEEAYQLRVDAEADKLRLQKVHERIEELKEEIQGFNCSFPHHRRSHQPGSSPKSPPPARD